MRLDYTKTQIKASRINAGLPDESLRVRSRLPSTTQTVYLPKIVHEKLKKVVPKVKWMTEKKIEEEFSSSPKVEDLPKAWPVKAMKVMKKKKAMKKAKAKAKAKTTVQPHVS